MNASEICEVIDMLRKECEIKEPSEKFGYLKALHDFMEKAKDYDPILELYYNYQEKRRYKNNVRH